MKIQKLIARRVVFLNVFTLFLVAISLSATILSVSTTSVVRAADSAAGLIAPPSDVASFGPNSAIKVGGDSDFTTITPTDFRSYIANAGTSILNVILVLVAVVAVLFLVLYGFQYLTAGGDPEKAKKARGGIINAIIGIVIIASAFYIVDVALQSSNIFSGIAATP